MSERKVDIFTSGIKFDAGKHAGSLWREDGTYKHLLCGAEFAEYYRLPLGRRKVTLVFSDKPHPDAWFIQASAYMLVRVCDKGGVRQTDYNSSEYMAFPDFMRLIRMLSNEFDQTGVYMRVEYDT